MKTKDIATQYGFNLEIFERFIEKSGIEYKEGFAGMTIEDTTDVNKIVEDYYQYNRELRASKELRENEAAKKKEEEQARIAKESAEKEEREKRTVEEWQRLLVEQGYESYYEYKVVSILDEKGHTNTSKIEELMNGMGLEGWRLRTSTTNEIGKNAIGLGLEGVGFGINSTVDETILYFERNISLRK